MTGPGHYLEGERLIQAIMTPDGRALSAGDHAEVIALAQAHFTAALAAATALSEGAGLPTSDWDAWVDAASAWNRPGGAS